MMLLASIIFLVASSAISPGVNEVFPCFQYGLFEVGDGDRELVMERIRDRFEQEDWVCTPAPSDTVSIYCRRAGESLRTDAVCETAIDKNYRYYFVIKDKKTGEITISSGKIALRAPIHDTFNFSEAE